MKKVRTKLFAGGARLTDGTLADALRNFAQREAKVLTAALTDLTDNSGGVAADGVMVAVPLALTIPGAGDTCPTKAEVEAAAGTVINALTEIAAQIVTINDEVPALTAPANNVGGAAADGTIAAVTKAFTGATSARVNADGFNVFVQAAADLIGELAGDINLLATAVADSALNVSALERRSDYSHDYAALSAGTGTAAADGTGSVTDAEAEASFTALADNIAELAAKLNSITGAGTVPLTVVAA